MTVTATSAGVRRTDDTDRRGRFSVSVPAGAITITATKTGYTFADRTVFADAGDTRSLGDIPAMGNVAPVNLAASRDTTDNANTFGTNVTVTWSAGPGGHAATYEVQTWVAATEQDPAAWSTGGTDVTPQDTTDEGTYTGSATATDGAMRIRVVATDDADVEYPSAAITVAAVNPVVSNVKASRNIDAEPDLLEVTWDAKGNDNSNWRILVKFGTETAWYEAADDGTGGAWSESVQEFGTATLDAIADGGTEKTVTPALAAGAMTFRVDYRQGETVDGVAVPWKTGPTASVAAKPAG